jgi:hypothetical protein
MNNADESCVAAKRVIGLHERWPPHLSTDSSRSCRVARGIGPPGPHQNRTRRFPPSGSSVAATRGYDAQIQTATRGRGRGNRAKSARNLSQVRRVRLLRRRSHFTHARAAAVTNTHKLRMLPFTP